MACGLGNGNINIYNINNIGSLISSLKVHTSFVIDMIQINFDLLACSSGDGTIRIWDLITNTIKFNLTGHIQVVYGLKLVSSDLLASGSFDYTIKLWDITNGRIIRTFTNHTNSILWSIDSHLDEVLLRMSASQTACCLFQSTG